MRLADDDRGRVPFALLGVLLLVTSATVATTQLTGQTPRTDPAVDRAMREATATTQTALRQAVTDAARAAARDPVTQRADTTYGGVLNDSGTFEDALRVRIYLAARERLGTVSAGAGDTTAGATLPAVDSPADLRAAKRRVHLSRAGPNGTALRVRVEGVRLRAVRAGRTVGEKRVAPTLTVAVPTLELHDRVERFETRLDAGLTAPGFERRFTAGLYAVAWVRGAAQYRGAPVASVVGNQHVALAANDAVLGVQRATLGGADPRGGDELRGRWAEALSTDLAPGSVPGPVVEETLRRGERGLRRLDDPREETVSVSPTVAADGALAATNGTTLDRLVARTYSVETRVVSDIEPLDTTVDRDPRPGPNWTRVEATTGTDRSVASATAGPSTSPSAPDGWTAFRRVDRRVTVRETTTTRWRRGDRTTTTTTVRTETHRVALAVVGRHSPDGRITRRGVAGVYETGGALDGPNLRGVPPRAVDRLVVARGGADALARRAVAGDLDTASERLVGERPVALRSWLRGDLAALDRRVRNVSVTLSRTDVGTYAVSPPVRLAARLRAQRATLLDAPATYDGMADRARVAVRRAYLKAVLAELDARAAARAEKRAALNETLGEHGSSLGQVRTSLDAAASMPNATGGPSTAGFGGPLDVAVDTAPTYLDVTPTQRSDFGGGSGRVTPLDARNLNWVTVPYGDAGGWFSRLVAGPERVSLRSAAGTLRASRRHPNGSAVPAVDRERLRGAVRDGVASVRDRLVGRLRATDACETTSDCRGVVDVALGHWATPADRALALANGSAPERVAAVAADGPASRRRLAATLRTTTREALAADAARPPQHAVRGVADGNRAALQRVTEEVATQAGEQATNHVLRRYLNRTLDDVPFGIPVAPVPGYWYATVNGWSVSVEGTYERLTVRSRRGARDTVYVRDGSAVGLDVDDDGERERLGTAPKLSFEASTTVVVVVPAGPRGIADVDGQRDERSPGYH